MLDLINKHIFQWINVDKLTKDISRIPDSEAFPLNKEGCYMESVPTYHK